MPRLIKAFEEGKEVIYRDVGGRLAIPLITLILFIAFLLYMKY
jgi:hypothetical protein